MQLAQDIGRRFDSQGGYDDATPAEDPVEPKFEGEVGDLMSGSDSCLLSYAAFRESADDDMYDLLPNASHTALLLAAMRSSDPVMRGMGRAAKQALEDHAELLLSAVWAKQQRKGVWK